jgi:hypothetical protein
VEEGYRERKRGIVKGGREREGEEEGVRGRENESRIEMKRKGGREGASGRARDCLKFGSQIWRVRP